MSIVLSGLCSVSCKKDKVTSSSEDKLEFSQDSILFDTVFTTIGSSTKNFRIRNTHSQKIIISNIRLESGKASPFIINVDGSKGTSFDNLEIAAHDSMYVFVQVKIDPTNVNSPAIVSDQIRFETNGNVQKMPLEAWGQDAYYHRPDSAIYFKDGSYLSYSTVNAQPHTYDKIGDEYVWKNDKPHVIYGYLVVDEKQKLRIQEGTKVYLNYKAGLWVYAGGQLQVLGKKGKEVIFQGARLEKEWADEPGQWDRIWINEGSDQNLIDYAIIKNGYVGVQAEFLGADTNITKRQLTLTNTKIQNMSLWGLYALAYKIYATNNVISNCQEHCLNIQLGGAYAFRHCTFANYWNKEKTRDKVTVNVNNYNTLQTIPLNFYMGNCLVDGKLDNELIMDLKEDPIYTYTFTFSNCWMKTAIDGSNTTRFVNPRMGDKTTILKYKDPSKYDFSPAPDEKRYAGFVHPNATADAGLVPNDIDGKARNTSSVTAGAYELP